METPRALPADDEDDDTAVVAAFLAAAGGLVVAAPPDAPTGVVLEAAPQASHKSPTSSCQASCTGPDDEDLLAGLL